MQHKQHNPSGLVMATACWRMAGAEICCQIGVSEQTAALNAQASNLAPALMHKGNRRPGWTSQSHDVQSRGSSYICYIIPGNNLLLSNQNPSKHSEHHQAWWQRKDKLLRDPELLLNPSHCTHESQCHSLQHHWMAHCQTPWQQQWLVKRVYVSLCGVDAALGHGKKKKPKHTVSHAQTHLPTLPSNVSNWIFPTQLCSCLPRRQGDQ